MKHLLILISLLLLSSFLVSCEKKEGTLYYHSSPLYINEKGVMTKDNYGWKGFVQKDKKEWIESYEGQVMKEFYFFGDFIPHGFGVEKIDNQIVYVGEYKDGKKHGQGTYTSLYDGSKYVGEFKDGRKNGQGTKIFPDGSKYVGEFKGGRYHGHGIFTFPDGRKYVGEYKRGRIWNGQGTYTWSDGTKYEGEWKEGKRHGQGTFTYTDGSKYVGDYDEIEMRLNGTNYDKDGKITGKFVNGEYIKQ
jgi:hypothetical protein